MSIIMKAFINASKQLIEEKKTTILFVITDDRELIDAVKKEIPDIHLIVATNKQPIQDDLMEMDYPVYCPICSGDGIRLGKMGALIWYRCQNCGIDFHDQSP